MASPAVHFPLSEIFVMEKNCPTFSLSLALILSTTIISRPLSPGQNKLSQMENPWGTMPSVHCFTLMRERLQALECLPHWGHSQSSTFLICHCSTKHILEVAWRGQVVKLGNLPRVNFSFYQETISRQEAITSISKLHSSNDKVN